MAVKDNFDKVPPKSGTTCVQPRLVTGRGTQGPKIGTSRQKRDGWQPYLRVATLFWEIKNSNFLQIFSRGEENANKLHLKWSFKAGTFLRQCSFCRYGSSTYSQLITPNEGGKWYNCVCSRGKNHDLFGKISKFCSESFHDLTDSRFALKFQGNRPPRSGWNDAVFWWHGSSQNAFSSAPFCAVRQRAPAVCRGRTMHVTLYLPVKFWLIWFRFAGVIPEKWFRRPTNRVYAFGI